MTKSEMTKLSAEAAGVQNKYPWNPLRDDGQAMFLVKKFGISLQTTGDGEWCVVPSINPRGHRFTYAEDEVKAKDLNRAIVECIARMQNDE